MPNESEFSLDKIKYKWKKFIISLLQISADALGKDEILIWSNNLTRLYDDYLINTAEDSGYNGTSCMNFEKYIFSKISAISDWQKCNSYQDLNSSCEWCQAWRRIMKSNVNVVLPNIEKPKKNVEKWSKSYLQDVETFMVWLSSKLLLMECPKKKSGVMQLPYNPYQSSKRTSGIIDIGFCYLTTIIPTMLTWKNQCRKVF